jgi:predicted DNA-binding mobile mystery protein A
MSSRTDARSLARKHLERRLADLRETDNLARPPRGWVRAIREALGMTTEQVARRAGLSQSRVPRIEQGEVNNTITLKTLRAIAEAMNCTLVYALVPNRPLDEMLRHRAREVANRQLARTHHTMKLENQALEPGDLNAEHERLIDELLRDPRRLWDEA